MPFKSFLFVINPVSGPDNKSWKDIIHNYFTEKPLIADYFILGSPPDASSLEKKIKNSGAEVIVAVGGDGTVSMLAKLLVNTQYVLGIIPAGSANGMAKELNIPADPNLALDIITGGKVKECDVIRINNKLICIHLCDIGLNAQLIKYFDQGKVRGQIGYAKMIIKTLWFKKKITATIYSGNSKITRDAFMIVLANASKYGSGAVINPVGELDDGIFEIIVIRKLALSELFKMLFKPQMFNPKKIEIFSGTSVSVTTSRRAHFQVDGEYLGKMDSMQAEIMGRSLKISLPL